MDMVEIVETVQRKSKNGPITVHCRYLLMIELMFCYAYLLFGGNIDYHYWVVLISTGSIANNFRLRNTCLICLLIKYIGLLLISVVSEACCINKTTENYDKNGGTHFFASILSQAVKCTWCHYKF